MSWRLSCMLIISSALVLTPAALLLADPSTSGYLQRVGEEVFPCIRVLLSTSMVVWRSLKSWQVSDGKGWARGEGGQEGEREGGPESHLNTTCRARASTQVSRVNGMMVAVCCRYLSLSSLRFCLPVCRGVEEAREGEEGLTPVSSMSVWAATVRVV